VPVIIASASAAEATARIPGPLIRDASNDCTAALLSSFACPPTTAKSPINTRSGSAAKAAATPISRSRLAIKIIPVFLIIPSPGVQQQTAPLCHIKQIVSKQRQTGKQAFVGRGQQRLALWAKAL